MQIDRMVFNGNCSGNICALDSFRVYYFCEFCIFTEPCNIVCIPIMSYTYGIYNVCSIL